jgi:hypothetical protein
MLFSYPKKEERKEGMEKGRKGEDQSSAKLKQESFKFKSSLKGKISTLLRQNFCDTLCSAQFYAQQMKARKLIVLNSKIESVFVQTSSLCNTFYKGFQYCEESPRHSLAKEKKE